MQMLPEERRLLRDKLTDEFIWTERVAGIYVHCFQKLFITNKSHVNREQCKCIKKIHIIYVFQDIHQ